ncbi:MAG: alpha/beta hydrolase family protein [Candidatus Acidiferrales bacterium]
MALALAGFDVAQARESSGLKQQQDVTFSSSGTVIAGTLVVPPKTMTAAVVVHGSGQEKCMPPFACELADNGVAALTYDKRGVGESGGTYVGPEVGTNNVDASNLQLLAEDASAAAQELIRMLPAPHPSVGLIGFSQAGWIISLAANLNSNVKFVVLLSGPVVTAREQMRFQDFTQQQADFWQQHTELEARERMRIGSDRFVFADTDPRGSLQLLSRCQLVRWARRQCPSEAVYRTAQAFRSPGKAI